MDTAIVQPAGVAPVSSHRRARSSPPIPITGSESLPDLGVQILRLQVEAALTVAPLIASVVAGMTDRRAVVADIVTCWLALPASVRARYQRLAGGSGGLERFGWDYIDTIEQGSGTDHDAAGMSAMDAERLVVHRWYWQLRRIRHAAVAENPTQRSDQDDRLPG